MQTQDKTMNGYYVRDMTGYYYSGQDKVDIRQQIYKKDSNVYTITASYDDINLPSDTELNAVFDSLSSSYL
jgi:hypothetical protein